MDEYDVNSDKRRKYLSDKVYLKSICIEIVYRMYTHHFSERESYVESQSKFGDNSDSTDENENH